MIRWAARQEPATAEERERIRRLAILTGLIGFFLSLVGIVLSVLAVAAYG